MTFVVADWAQRTNYLSNYISASLVVVADWAQRTNYLSNYISASLVLVLVLFNLSIYQFTLGPGVG